MLRLSIIVMTLFYVTAPRAQAYPVIGKRFSTLEIRDVQGLNKKTIHIGDLKGKWAIIDFWSLGCGACVASFPHLNTLSQQFNDRVRVVLVGWQDKDRKIQQQFHRFQQLEKLSFPYAFDSTIFKRLDIFALPYVVLLDSTGTVRAITTGLNTTDLTELLAGRMPLLRYAYREHEERHTIPYDISRPFLVGGNGGVDSDYIFRSVLTHWRPNMIYSIPQTIAKTVKVYGQFQALGVGLKTLYNYAYWGTGDWEYGDSLYGKVFQNPILSLEDSISFREDPITGANLFCYAINMANCCDKVAVVQSTLRQDLVNAFGFNPTVEEREIEYWALIVKDSNAYSILKTRSLHGQTEFLGQRGAGTIVKNLPLDKLVRTMQINLQSTSKTPFIILNETGIKGNIDIDLSDCLLSDFAGLKKSLNRYGLDFVSRTRLMKVLVISDKRTKIKGLVMTRPIP